MSAPFIPRQRKPAAPPADGLMDLFGGQDIPMAPVEPVEPTWGAVGVTWPKMLSGRHLCQDCVALIHGNPGGPQPRSAVARRKGPNGELLLCHEHAQHHKDADARAERDAAARKEAADSARRGVLAAKGYGKRREHA